MFTEPGTNLGQIVSVLFSKLQNKEVLVKKKTYVNFIYHLVSHIYLPRSKKLHSAVAMFRFVMEQDEYNASVIS